MKLSTLLRMSCLCRHDWTSWTLSADRTRERYVIRACVVCGQVETRPAATPPGHVIDVEGAIRRYGDGTPLDD